KEAPVSPVQLHDPPVAQPEMVTVESTYCETHPAVATWMRCNKCNRRICLKCAVQTPVGYRCKQCVRAQQDVYFNAKEHDSMMAFAVSFVSAAIVAPIAGIMGSSLYFYGFYAAFIAGPGAGMILAQVVRWAVGRRRSRYMCYFVVTGIVLGIL